MIEFTQSELSKFISKDLTTSAKTYGQDEFFGTLSTIKTVHSF
jgi:hypothetical protein